MTCRQEAETEILTGANKEKEIGGLVSGVSPSKYTELGELSECFKVIYVEKG